MAGDRSNVRVTFIGDAQSLARAAQAAQGSLSQVAQSVGKASKMGTFFGSAAGNLAAVGLGKLKEFATGSVDAFARVEDATGAAGVQFGDQLGVITAFANSAAKNFGISKGAAIDAANTFGTLGKSAGLTGQDLSGFATDLTGLAGDLASFKGTSTQQAIDAVGAAMRGETEPIRAYGVLLDAASLQAEAMSTGLVKATKNVDAIKAAHMRAELAQSAYNKAVKDHGKDSTEAQRASLGLNSATTALKKVTEGSIPPLTNQQKVLAAQSAILKQTKDAQGDFNRTSASTANVQKRQAAETENAQAKLGQQLAPALTAVRAAATKAIVALSGMTAGISAAAAFVTNHQGTFKALAAVITVVMLPAMASLVVGYVRTAAAAAASAARQVAAWLATQASAYGTIATQAAVFAVIVAGWIRSAATATASALRMAAAWIIAMGPIAIAIAAVVGITILIIKNWDRIKAATVAAWNAVVGFIKSAVSKMISVLANFTGPGLIIKHWDRIVAIVKAVPGKLASAVGDFVQLGIDIVQGFINGIVNKAKELPGIVGNALVAPVKNAIAGVKGFFSHSPSRWATEQGHNVGDGLANGISDRAKKVAEKTQAMVDKAKEKLAEIKDFAKAIRDAFTSSGDLSSLDSTGDSGSLLDQLRKKAEQATAFAKGLTALRKAGLNQISLGQLRDAGPDQGNTAVQQLLAGGGIGEVNRLMKQIKDAGTGLGNSESKAVFGVGADNNLKSLNKQEVRVILDLRGDDADLIKRIRKQIRVQGGNVQQALGA